MPNSPLDPPDVAFEFVRSLAAELSAGKVDLPSFPEIAVRVRRVLSDPKSSVDQVARVVGSEPALAARLMRLANSAALNRSGRPVADLRTAINRLGHNMVRSAAIAFAMAQIRNANRLVGLEHYLNDLWQASTRVAALAYVLARTCSRVNPDEAMLGGMMHGIGKLYVVTRAVSHPELFSDKPMLDRIVNDWHAAIGKAILENWDFSEEMAEAVGEQQNHGRDPPAAADLRDVIAVAVVMAAHFPDLPGLEKALGEVPGALRLGLDRDKTPAVVQGCIAEVSALNDALGS
ncbi:MAG: HDOD domain-containing protein [Pseudomonadota bacterium]|nr:HDOD domain-containing protein [Pseudomonadota bacterium]